METYRKGLEYESLESKMEEEIEKAKEQGRVEGRNAKIDELRKAGRGDGLPKPSTGPKSRNEPKEEKDIFDQALTEEEFSLDDI